MINGIQVLREVYSNHEEESFQPSGLDLKLGKVYKISNEGVCGIVDGEKIIPNHIPLEKTEMYDTMVWVIKPNTPYIFEVDRQVKIGDENAQFYLPRSTLLREGVNVYTALGDTGYNGRLSFLVINHRLDDFVITEGERFAQLVDFQVTGVDSTDGYDGDHQEEVEE